MVARGTGAGGAGEAGGAYLPYLPYLPYPPYPPHLAPSQRATAGQRMARRIPIAGSASVKTISHFASRLKVKWHIGRSPG